MSNVRGTVIAYFLARVPDTVQTYTRSADSQRVLQIGHILDDSSSLSRVLLQPSQTHRWPQGTRA